ncbi:MAG: hypothetical protein HQL34_00785 [Alphaproteobacteria bacterium]|nr:hypothetical protein [Alphaproteobacteria bacterium]
MAKKPQYTVHLIDSPAGQVTLASRGLTTRDLARAIAEFQKRENVRVGTLIGVSRDGFFGSTREGWRPDQPDAFAEPLVNIPWVQLLELLDRVPDGTTGEFLKSGGNQH